MSAWVECRIGEVVTLQQGLCINAKSKHLLSDEGYPLLRITDLINSTEVQFINKHKVQEKFLAKTNSIIYTRTGQVGLVFKGKSGVLHNNCFSITPCGLLDRDYLYWFLKTSFAYSYANNVAAGAAQPDLGHGPFKSMYISFPRNLETQRKIAAILSAYDDLIENNKRRIALLEKMAEEIYREWFVRFRFPGYQQAEFEKGIPKNWRLKPFSEAVSINPTERPHKDDLKPYVGMEALSTSSMYFESTEARIGNSGSKFRNGDTLFPRITPCLENGKRGYVMCLKDDEVAIGSTEFIVMREKDLTKEYIYLLSCFEPFRTHAQISMVGASGRQRVAENCFSFFLIPIPPKEILESFSSIVEPMFDSIKVLNDEANVLEKAKSSLLPRLISGKLSVEELEIQFPPSMQEEVAA